MADFTKNEIRFQSEMIKTDVISVKIIDNFIFAGVGNILHVFNLSHDKHTQFRVLKGHRIHGLVINNAGDKLAVYGNREIVMTSISFAGNDVSVVIVDGWIVGDWIRDVGWQNDPNEIMILTANNIVSLWNWKIKAILNSVLCQNKCLLYSGIILGNEWRKSLIICGSMFKTILIWAPSTANGDKCTAMHKLQGHKGAIFSVFYHQHLQLICSTSDDRSVKIWRVTFPFHSDSVVDSWAKANIFPILTVYGHMSRVWKSVILDNARFITAGEDSQLRIWNPDGTPVCSWETHQGASIRCFDVSEKLGIIITGSKDGGLSRWPLSTNYSQFNYKTNKIKFSDSFSIQRIQDIPRRILVTKSGKLLTVTNKGLLLAYTHQQWDCINSDSRFASYCLFEISPNRQCVTLASITGDVKIFEECEGSTTMNMKFDETICTGKIFSFHWLSANQFITCCVDGNLEIWRLQCDQITKKCSIIKLHEFILPPCKERWLTSAVQFDTNFVVGDRDGSIHLFSNNLLPTKTFRRVHGRLGVSCIWRGGNTECFSVGRDGFIRYWNVLEYSLEQAAADKLPVKWPARVIQSPLYDLLVVGFNEVNFEVWIVKERKQLLKYKCGGGHRPWDFIIDQFAQFVYIKEKMIFSVVLPLDQLMMSSFLRGFHIREIDCLRYLNENLVISGGEDTTLRLSILDSRNDIFTPVSIIRSHISSVRAISFKRVHNYFLVVSAGGRAQLNVCKIFTTQNGVVNYNELASHMLRPTKKCRKPWKSMIYTFELEPRHMDLQIRQITDDSSIYIYAAGSDAYWRIYLFKLETKSLELIKEIEYAGYCILRILLVKWSNEEFIITMATDGKATFWNLNSHCILYQHSLHQSGINCCDFTITDENLLVLVTGGDDASLSISLFDNKDNKISFLSQWQNGSIHEAQVSGIRILKNFIITAGADQKVVLWRWLVAPSNKVLGEYISFHRSFVPDIHGLDVTSFARNEICVYGAGFEIFTVKL